MKKTMVECDAPSCGSVAPPEWQNGTEYGTPYGWWKVEATCVGSGPSVDIEVCDISCVAEAMEATLRRQYTEEVEEMEQRIEDRRREILAIPCPKCGANAGENCITKNGGYTGQFHASRRNTA